jgi:hypothetical protein
MRQGKPLNGEKTHPLKPASLDVLHRLRNRPIPYQEINPGVIDRLTREGLAEVIQILNPYQTKAKTIRGLEITPRGIALLSSLTTEKC